MAKLFDVGVWGLFLWLVIATLAHAGDAVVFKTPDGESQTVESHLGNGKWLVVKIWASDCHVCNAEAENYAYFHETQGEDGIRVLGLSMDGEARKADILAYIERHDLPFPNLIGDAQSVGAFYSALTKAPLLGTPTILVFDPKGELAAAQAGAVPPEVIERFVDQRSAQQAAG